MPKKLITAALPYANGSIHIGHLSGVYIPADIYYRYLKLKGEDVLFICGSDEHGVPVSIRAKKEGVGVQEVVDKYHNIIKKSFQDFNINFDIYHRTSGKDHHQLSQEFFLSIKDKLVEIETEQYFDTEVNQFLADRYILGTCPKCSYENAYGDQCEKCGSTLSPDELINPRSSLSGKTPEKRPTKHWYLPLADYETTIREWIESKKDWKVNVTGQCKSWLDSGLTNRAITRDLEWGVKVPGEEGKVLYVWFDAPIGYITATKKYCEENGLNWEDYWKNEETEITNFIGKDNIVFHTIIFPTMLLSHGAGYQLPKNIPANEFLNLEGNKISTSRNWAVWLDEFISENKGKEDVLRYVLTATMPETKDNDFTWQDFQSRNNNELVSIFGNYVNRVLTLSQKTDFVQKSCDVELIGQVYSKIEDIEKSINNFRFRESLGHFMDIVRIGNKFLSDTEPWKLNDEPEKKSIILWTSLQIIRKVAILSDIFLPNTSLKLRDCLKLNEKSWDLLFEEPNIESYQKIEHLFERIGDEFVEKEKLKLESKKSQ